jgi:hypothetical protein
MNPKRATCFLRSNPPVEVADSRAEQSLGGEAVTRASTLFRAIAWRGASASVTGDGLVVEVPGCCPNAKRVLASEMAYGCTRGAKL